MGEPLGLRIGDDSWHRKIRPGSQTALPTAAAGDAGVRPLARPFIGFELERDTYKRLKPVLLAQAPGQFVAVVGDAYAGPADTFDDAERMGYARFGIGPLYIKQVLVEEPTVDVSRDIGS